MDSSEAGLEFPSGDPPREYTPEQERRVSLQLYQETLRIAQGAFETRRIDLDLLREWHRNVFRGVKHHAGEHRTQRRGTPTLIILGTRAPREAVEERLDETLSKLHSGLRQFSDNPDDPAYEDAAFHWAVWVHAQVISIQPFEDGNKRVARLLLSHVLVTLGFDVLTFDHCRDEYLDALGEFFGSGDLSVLRDLAIRTYVDAL